jgi:hypothetical protein
MWTGTAFVIAATFPATLPDLYEIVGSGITCASGGAGGTSGGGKTGGGSGGGRSGGGDVGP